MCLSLEVARPWFNVFMSYGNTNEIYGLPYWLTQWRWALLERPPVVQPFENLAFYGTQSFITVFTHKSPPLVAFLRQINLVHTTPFYFFQINLNIILPSMSKASQWDLGLQEVLLFLCDVMTKIGLHQHLFDIFWKLCRIWMNILTAFQQT
jgi:hypothetical protein